MNQTLRYHSAALKSAKTQLSINVYSKILIKHQQRESQAAAALNLKEERAAASEVESTLDSEDRSKNKKFLQL